ncbi:MAG: DUF2845 domain-containing protein [Steroidobacteraceae bacterium]
MARRIPTACAAFGLLCAAGPLARADTLRCGNRLIDTGESMAAVQALCGQPALVQRGAQFHASTVGPGAGNPGRSDTAGAAVPVQTWTYNRGPHKLMVSVRFVNGTVVSIRTLHEWGY